MLFKEESPDKLTTKLFKLFIAIVLSIPAGLVYIPSSEEYVKNGRPLYDLLPATLYPASGFMTGVATQLFTFYLILKNIHSRKIPKELSQYFIQEKNTCQSITALLASCISATPLTLLYVVNSEKQSTYVTVPLAVIIHFAYTILHLLPIQLILSHPVYGFPLYPIIQTCSKKKTTSLLTSALISRASQLYLNITKNLFHRMDPADTLTLPDNFSDLFNNRLFSNYSVSDEKCCMRGIVLAVRILSALWIFASTCGYSNVTYTGLQNYLESDTVAIALSAPVIYMTSLLMLFFGDLFAQQTIVPLITGHSKIPDHIKYGLGKCHRALPTTLFIVLCAVMALPSFATGSELIAEMNPSWLSPELKNIIFYASIPGLIFCGFMSLINILDLALGELAQNHGPENWKAFFKARDLLRKLPGIFGQLGSTAIESAYQNQPELAKHYFGGTVQAIREAQNKHKPSESELSSSTRSTNV